MAPKKRTKKAPAKKAVSRKPARRAVARSKKKPTPKRAVSSKKASSMKKAVTKPAAPKKAAPKKAAPKKAAPKKASKVLSRAAAKSPTPKVRRDRAGHFDPSYEADLRAKSLEGRDTPKDETAFVRGSHSRDDLAEELGEETVATMTTGEDAHEESLEQAVDEERGGPFVESSSNSEFAGGSDESNPADATREPFPKT